jgi:ribosomal protein S27AE
MGHKEAQKARMRCPGCGAEMNQHAFKIDYSADDQNGDVSFDGVLQEVHTCPTCGRTELRTS